MTLIKSILMGSAACILAVASAEAADLPTRKAAPVEYVKVCNVGGFTGWTLPGSDTCVKFSGYITGQFEGGNLNTQYTWGSISNLTTTTAGTTTVTTTTGGTVTVPSGTSTTTGITGTIPSVVAGTPSYILSNSQVNQRVLVAASTVNGNTTFFRNETGWTTRANFGFDIASNTAYGPLIGHFDLNSETGTRSTTSTPPTSTRATSPGRESPPVRRSRSTRSPAAATIGRTSPLPTRRASTSLTSWPTPPRSAVASPRRSRRKALAKTG
jgi:hypothetical protein